MRKTVLEGVVEMFFLSSDARGLERVQVRRASEIKTVTEGKGRVIQNFIYGNIHIRGFHKI